MTPTIINLTAIVLTIMVLSRVAGDNPLYRVAQYLFVGTSLGLAFVITYHQVLRPATSALLLGSENALLRYGVPLLLGLLLLPRITRRQSFSWMANFPLALIFGVGIALALGGAIIGTLLPQLIDTASRPLNGSIPEVLGVIVLAFGTIATLSAFYYTVPRDTRLGRGVIVVGMFGHWLLMIAFGFFFASALQTYLSALTERLGFLLSFLGFVGS